MSADIELIEHQKSSHTRITGETRLSICLKADGFSFSIVDNRYELCELGRFRVILQGGIPDIIQRVRECFALLKITMFKFLSTTILLPSQKQTWVPLKLYDPTQDKEYLTLATGMSFKESPCKDILPDMDMVSLFAYPTEVVSALKIVMPGARFISTQQRMVEYGYSIAMEGTQILLLNRHDNIMDMAFFQNSDFLGSVAYEVKHFSDFLYFLLFTTKHVGLNQEKAGVYLTGDSFDEEELISIRTFFRDVKVLPHCYDVNIGETFAGKDLTPYFLLLQ